MELGQPGLGGLAPPPGLTEPVPPSGPLGQEAPMVGLATPAVLPDVFQVSQVLLCRATIDSLEGGVHPRNGPKLQGPGVHTGL